MANSDICDKMNGPGEHCVKQNKPGTDRFYMISFICTWNFKSLSYRTRKQKDCQIDGEQENAHQMYQVQSEKEV